MVDPADDAPASGTINCSLLPSFIGFGFVAVPVGRKNIGRDDAWVIGEKKDGYNVPQC